MSARRTVSRLAGSIALVAVLGTAAVIAAARSAAEDTTAAPDVTSAPEAAEILLIGDAEEPQEEPDEPVAAVDDPTGTAPGVGAPVGPGAAEATSDPSFQPRAPEAQATVFAEVAAYRAARSLPTSADQQYPNWPCVWGPGGTTWPSTTRPSESLGAALIRLLPAAVAYQGPVGSETVVLVSVHSYTDSATGTTYPGQLATIAVKHCSPPPPPVQPSPPPVQPSPPPVEPSLPPVEPSTPPAEPSTPPAEPEPLPTP